MRLAWLESLARLRLEHAPMRASFSSPFLLMITRLSIRRYWDPDTVYQHRAKRHRRCTSGRSTNGSRRQNSDERSTLQLRCTFRTRRKRRRDNEDERERAGCAAQSSLAAMRQGAPPYLSFQLRICSVHWSASASRSYPMPKVRVQEQLDCQLGRPRNLHVLGHLNPRNL